MSRRNGDKARFVRERKKKMIRRRRSQALRTELAGNARAAKGAEIQDQDNKPIPGADAEA
jgi:hypothetical protein